MQPGRIRIITLGTGAPLHRERANLSLHVSAGDSPPLLLDTGGGLEIARQMARAELSLGEVRHVVLTHRHGDHIGGAMAFTLAGLLDVRYYGLPDALDAARQLVATTFPELEQPPADRFTAVRQGESLDVAGFRLEFYSVRHRVPTLAVRLEREGRAIAYSADSLPCEELVACARDADVFICDALVGSGDGAEAVRRAESLMHPTGREAGEMARLAGAKSLALVHLASFSTREAVLSDASAAFGGPTSVPDDGTVIELA